MKRHIFVCAAMLTAACVAQAAAGRPTEGTPPPPRPERGDIMLMRTLNDRALIRGLGISEESVAKIDEANRAVNERIHSARLRIEELSAKQLALATEIFSTPGSDPAPLMDVIAEIGQLRITTAQEMTRRMLILRDNLTQEQMKTLKTRIDEQRKQRREQMQKEGISMGERGRRFGDRPQGERPTGERFMQGERPARGERPAQDNPQRTPQKPL